MVITGFKSIGPAAALLFADGTCTLIVTPRLGRAARGRAVPAGKGDRGRRSGGGAAHRCSAMVSRRTPMIRSAPPGWRRCLPAWRARSARRCRSARRPTSSCSTPPAPRPSRRSACPRGGAHRRARLHAAARDRAARHDRGRARGRAQGLHEDARGRGQFPAAVRRSAQPRGPALDRPQARSRATSSWPRSRRAFAASSPRSAAPWCSASRPRCSAANTSWWCRR